jgi:two-component system response regulator HydG
LRERREDIAPLIEHILEGLRRQSGRDLGVSPAALDVLLGYGYPGNVRELENALHWAAALCSGEPIAPEHLPDHFLHHDALAPAKVALEAAPNGSGLLSAMTKQCILDTLDRHQGNLTHTAKALGISRTTLWRKMKEYELT